MKPIQTEAGVVVLPKDYFTEVLLATGEFQERFRESGAYVHARLGELKA